MADLSALRRIQFAPPTPPGTAAFHRDESDPDATGEMDAAVDAAGGWTEVQVLRDQSLGTGALGATHIDVIRCYVVPDSAFS